MTLVGAQLERYRLALVIASAVALLLASLVVAAYNEEQYRRQVAQSTHVQALVLAETATAALSFGDRDSLQEYARAMRANASIEAVGVYDDGGELVAEDSATSLPERISELTPEESHGRVAVLQPVLEKNVRLGTVYVRSREERPLARVARYLGPGLLVVMASLMFLVMALDARRLMRANREISAEMAERAKAEAALRQGQKMEAIGRLTGGIAHDFNNMLAVVLGSLDLVLRRFPDADPVLLRFVENAAAGGKRAAALTRRLLAFSRLQPLNPTSVDVNRSMSDMSDLLRRTLGEKVRVETRLGEDAGWARIDLAQLETAILNLAINARDAMPDGGQLTIETSPCRLDLDFATLDEEVTPGPYVAIAIADTGAGIAPDILSQVFEPFFTTKPPGAGTGLGLSQVHGFIKQSGGHIRIDSKLTAGTTVRLYLPCSNEAPIEARPASRTSQQPPRRDVTVLVAEDEAGVREFAVEALSQLGYEVLAADGGRQALELMQAHPEVGVLLTDVVMPEMNGRELAEEALRRSPKLRVLYMTGYARDVIVHDGVLEPGAHMISKPFTLAQMASELEAVLQAP